MQFCLYGIYLLLLIFTWGNNMTLPVTIIDNDNAVDLVRFRIMILTESDGIQSLLYSGILRLLTISTIFKFFLK